MCLNAIALTAALATNNMMAASQSNFFSRLVSDQNLRSLPIFHLRKDPSRRERLEKNVTRE
jgi:hypothetical protein